MKFDFKKLALGVALGFTLLGGAAAVAQDAKHEIVTVVKLSGIAWFNRMEAGVAEYAEETGNNATQVGPASADAALQVQMIEDLIARNVNAITVVPNSPEALEPVLAKALEAGIKVVGHEASSLENVTYDVEAFDNAAYGVHLMEALAQDMGGEGEYAVFVGHLTAKTHNEWVDAAIAYQKEKYPKMTLVGGKIESNEQQQTAYQKTKELLRTYPNLKGIQGSAGEDVVGAALAVEEAGLTGKVTIVGTSLVSVAGPYLETGEIKMISFWDPAKAGIAMNKVAAMAIEGKEVTDGMDLGVEGYNSVKLDGKVIYGQAWVDVTKDNMDEYDF
ncbi:autoinducer 2 ABC transporter substrate-binding protein [Aquamicrobium sp. LC103]|uniref:autoinducer 2 ABC transporter substrate-binding protein n=1 Tax=Aquamicrobium sp. LC103 TaxID=1120658 RepID=UPI00063E81C5|nr:autoinducer 2 ABC transporter substrate-binding protein [Aquamicrobium sp. LC103]TKT74688.1 autoinducer 2 ABC transporter substrate-binding protein [Aquamicrobium sp. LC103]